MTDPVPEASVLTRSEPTENLAERLRLAVEQWDDVPTEKIIASLHETNFAGGSTTIALLCNRLSELLRAQAALPVPAGRKATPVAWRGKTPHGYVLGHHKYHDGDEPLYAAPVPADRSGEWPLIKALLRKAERFATEEYQRRVECHDAVREAAFIEEAKELADELFKVVVRPDPPLLSLKGEGK